MKKFILLSLFLLSCLVGSAQAPLTPEQTINLWDKRYVPPQDEVEQTFESIVFKTEKDSFAYVDISGFVNATQGVFPSDSLFIIPEPKTADNGLTYISTRFQSRKTVGYPVYATIANTVTINSSVNSAFDPTDTLTLEVTANFWKIADVAGVDSVEVRLFAPQSGGGGSAQMDSTVALIDNQLWQAFTFSLQINFPVNSENQTFLIWVRPKFEGVDEYVNVANVSAKLYNTNP